MDWLKGSVNPFQGGSGGKTFEELIHSVHQQQLLQAEQGYAALKKLHDDCRKEFRDEEDMTLQGIYSRYEEGHIEGIITHTEESNDVQSKRQEKKSSVPAPPLTEPLGYE